MSPWLIVGALLYGALYLQNVIVAGLFYGNRWAVIFGLMALGVSFLSYAAGITWKDSPATMMLIYASWALGVAAGLALLF